MNFQELMTWTKATDEETFIERKAMKDASSYGCQCCDHGILAGTKYRTKDVITVVNTLQALKKAKEYLKDFRLGDMSVVELIEAIERGDNVS